MKLFLALVFSVHFFSVAQAEIDPLPDFTLICGLFTDQGNNPSFPTIGSSPDIYKVRVPLAMPGEAPDYETFGYAFKYTSTDGRQLSCGTRYDYLDVNISEDWHKDKPRKEDPTTTHHFTQVDNKAFWDWYYKDYMPPAQCD
jgi:hypothetical protein